MVTLLAALLAAMPGALAGATSPANAAPSPGIEDLARHFADPPDDSRIMMRWWWFGPAVTRMELERELRAMKAAGIGGVEIQPVYPVSLDDDARGIRTLPFLSDEFLDALRFANDKGRELGLRVDLTVGSGWPYGGATVPVAQAAARLRVEHVRVPWGAREVARPDVGAGEALIGVFGAAPGAEAREITDVAGGVIRLDHGGEGAPALPELLVFIESRTGMMVKRAAIGAEGFVLDHYDRGALDGYLRTVGDRLLSAFGTHPPYSVFCDSLEAYGSDWTGDFLPEFRRRRGYDLRPLLPALVTDGDPRAPALRDDWGRTLGELVDERFLAPMAEWARNRGTRLRVQAYGIPPATIASNVHADISDGEGADWKTLRASRWASSANHLFGRTITSSETWTWLHSPSFRATPLDMKVEADRHFLQGVNQLIGHGWPYSAPGVDYPGWRFYAAGAFDDGNPWWIAMPDVSRYLQRASYLLRQGQPVADVAVYLPDDDAWSHFVPGHMPSMIDALADRIGPEVVAQVLEAGFGLDFVDDGTVRAWGRVEGGALAVGPNRYRAVVLPRVERLPLATLRTLDALAAAGGVVIATGGLPADAAGFAATDAERREVRETAERLFRSSDARGRLVTEAPDALRRALAQAATPDVVLAPAAPDVGFVHRRTADADIYFLANTANVPRKTVATFRVDAARRAEWWDPMTGQVRAAAAGKAGRALAVALDLEPYGSRFLVFTARRLPEGGTAGAARPRPPIDISTGWTVRFGDAPAVPLASLRSWTDDDRTRHFSGVATYEREVVLPAPLVENGARVRLDLGEARPFPPPGAKARLQALVDAPVREAAVVEVNGRRAGSVWCPPYALEIGSLLHAGANTITIRVGNLAINHLAGHALPDYRLLNLRYGVRFEPQDMDDLQPIPSGLLGPIRLVPIAAR